MQNVPNRGGEKSQDLLREKDHVFKVQKSARKCDVFASDTRKITLVICVGKRSYKNKMVSECRSKIKIIFGFPLLQQMMHNSLTHIFVLRKHSCIPPKSDKKV